ncbi:MAG TPA: hypothetical protein VKQ28_14335 [Candidatus Acidoferrum sp.]|nr:hypothetical protein [Candidatus Acidoferrum sp.]
MIEPLEYKELAAKLLEKTKAGKLTWIELEGRRSETFYCDLDSQYTFSVWKEGDSYGLNMKPQSSSRVLFAIQEQEEIYFSDPKRKEIFEVLSDLYELARRQALNLPDNLANVAELLDKI